jgi:DNA-directed RNA polymerase subunit omega
LCEQQLVESAVVFCSIGAKLKEVSLLRIFKPSLLGGWSSTFAIQRRLRSTMNADLVTAACKVVPNQEILVNMVSRRVRQLCLGHRPMVVVPPGMREADTALTEIIEKKLSYESTLGQNKPNATVVQFPGVIVSKKKAA